MAKNSKKQQKRKIERRRNRKLEAQLAEVEGEDNVKIPANVARSPSLPDYLDGKNYQLIFEEYNHRECEIPSLDNKSTKALIGKLNEITRVNSRSIASTTLIRDRVIDSGDYASLFRNLEADIDLFEIKYAGSGRIICYFIDEWTHSDKTVSNYCCIVAILRQHRRT